MNYWRGSRVTTNFSSITHPLVLDGSTGKVHFFGISTGAGSPQVVQTNTALGSVVTATVETRTRRRSTPARSITRFRISDNSGGDRRFQWWNERYRRRQREY